MLVGIPVSARSPVEPFFHNRHMAECLYGVLSAHVNCLCFCTASTFSNSDPLLALRFCTARLQAKPDEGVVVGLHAVSYLGNLIAGEVIIVSWSTHKAQGEVVSGSGPTCQKGDLPDE